MAFHAGLSRDAGVQRLPTNHALDRAAPLHHPGADGLAIQRTHLAHGFLKPAPIDLFLHQVHAWSGWLILLMALLQLAIRLVRGKPLPPDGTSRLEARVASATHIALYGLLIALPVTGTIAMYLTFRVAPLHRYLSWLLLALVLIHIVAALWHHLYRRDDVLRRMIKG